MEIQGTVGPQVLSDGAVRNLRQGRQGEAITQDAHGSLYEAVYRGYCFTVSNAVAGVAPGTALSTTPPLILYNPPTSGKNLALLTAGMGYVSGTLGAGTVAYANIAQTTSPGATLLTPKNNLLGAGAPTVAIASTGGTITLPTILRPSGLIMAPILASTAIPWPLQKDYINGEFILAPGNAFCMQGIATAGSTPLVIFSLTWEEVPL